MNASSTYSFAESLKSPWAAMAVILALRVVHRGGDRRPQVLWGVSEPRCLSAFDPGERDHHVL